MEQGAIIGVTDIARYCGISLVTVWRWRRLHGFPATTLPDGRIYTTKSLIDKWVMSRQDCIGRLNQSPGRPRKVKTDKQGLAADSSSSQPLEPGETA